MAHDASSDMIPRDIEYSVKVGSRKTLSLTLEDSCNCVVAMCCACVYSTGTWKVFKPCGTSVFCGAVVYSNRSGGVVTYSLGACDATSANKGAWAGEVEYKNVCCVISDHSKTFRFNIKLSV